MRERGKKRKITIRGWKERKSDHHLVPGQFIIGKKRAKSRRKKDRKNR